MILEVTGTAEGGTSLAFVVKFGKPIPARPGYRVTADGTVWTLRTGKPAALKPYKHKRGHHRVKIAGRHYPVHLLVITLFVGPRPSPELLCLHQDGNPANNWVHNLRWGTTVDSWDDRRAHGRGVAGEQNPQAKLSAEEVAGMRADHAAGLGLKAVALKYCCPLSTARNVIAGRTWAPAKEAVNA